jgi:hypothetical protein
MDAEQALHAFEEPLADQLASRVARHMHRERIAWP